MPPNNKELEFVFPPQPSIMLSIQKEMSKDEPDLRHIAKQIAGDITLSASLLRTVNSPYYGLRNKVSSASEAVNLIGLTLTKHLVTTVSLRESVPMPHGLENFWEDMTKIAVMSASIARHLRLDADLAYLLGLFHDVAVPLMATRFPDYLNSLTEFHGNEQEISEAEQDKYNMNHAMLGSLFARAWFLPASIIQAVRCHHNHDLFEMSLDSGVLNILSAFLIAENICDRINGGLDAHFPMLENKIRAHLNLLDETHYQLLVDKAMDSINQ